MERMKVWAVFLSDAACVNRTWRQREQGRFFRFPALTNEMVAEPLFRLPASLARAANLAARTHSTTPTENA